jgi:hypothetical protein
MLNKALKLSFGLFIIGSSSFAQQWNGNNNPTDVISRDGNVGIGTSTPTGHLSFGSMGEHLTIGIPSWTNQAILRTGWTSGIGDFTELRVPGTEANNVAQLRMLHNGSVGIGTNTPTGHLSFGNMGDHLTIGLPGFTNKVILKTGWTGGIGDYTEIRVPGTEPNNVAQLRILHNGSVGIGTNTPTGHLSFGSMGNHLTIGIPGFASQAILSTGWNGTNGDYTELRVPGSAANNALLRIQANGNVGIGTDNPGSFKLAVEGRIAAREIQVTAQTPFPDYVFASSYKLRSLYNLENYINQNKHLPGIPSAAEVEKKGGIELGQMNTKLLEKIEELTLYVIELNKKIEKLEKEKEASTGK